MNVWSTMERGELESTHPSECFIGEGINDKQRKLSLEDEYGKAVWNGL